MEVDLDEANRMAQAKPRYLASRRRYGRFIKINFSNLCRRSRFKCCLIGLPTIFLIRFDVESWNFRHKIWKAEGRKLSNISKIDAPGTALGEEILKLKFYSIMDGVAELFLVSEPGKAIGKVKHKFSFNQKFKIWGKLLTRDVQKIVYRFLIIGTFSGHSGTKPEKRSFSLDISSMILSSFSNSKKIL